MTEDELNAIADRADARAYENGPVEDSFEACASDLRQSAKHDRLGEIPACMNAVADRIDVLRRLSPLDVAPAPENRMALQLAANTDLLTYALQDDVHNRLTPRVIDIAYTAFMQAKRTNKDDGGPSDWFNDTRPLVKDAIEKLRRDLAAETKPGREFFAVVIASGAEGVVFTDEACAKFASTGEDIPHMFGVPTIADHFRKSYDEQDNFEIIRLREVL